MNASKMEELNVNYRKIRGDKESCQYNLYRMRRDSMAMNKARALSGVSMCLKVGSEGRCDMRAIT